MPVPARLQPWLNHLNSVRKANPKLSLKEAMIKAKVSYRKGGKKGGLRGIPSFDDLTSQPKMTAEQERRFRQSLYE